MGAVDVELRRAGLASSVVVVDLIRRICHILPSLCSSHFFRYLVEARIGERGHPHSPVAMCAQSQSSPGEHGFHFDTVQMPLNVMDAHFRSFGQLVLPELVKHEIGVLGMKAMGDGVILKSKTVSPIECLHYALNLPTSVVITGIDKPEILDQAFEAVKTFQPMNREQVAQLLAKTKEVAMAGKYELFKTSSHFDSTAKHPDWLGGDTPDVQKLAPPSA